MKAIFVMFDSLNRHHLPPYGCNWTHAPNFARLARRCATFDKSYVCSLPCMPARRELHTSRPNFLHRSWGPLEPFDDSVPEILKNAGIYTHLASDHLHYWEDGGCTYHSRYSSWEHPRGQEGDIWIGQVKDPEIPPHLGQIRRQDWVNRAHITREELFPQAKTFAAGLEFLERNAQADNWFLQIETFDPHEPFFAPQRFKDLYPHAYDGPHFDWPDYNRVTEPPEVVEHGRLEYAALLSMCDEYLGRVLDVMDAQNLWDDTLLIVGTDHGFLLGEHEFWAKMRMPVFQELANTPFFIWDPRSKIQNERRQSLVQPSLDIGSTLLDWFGLQPTEDMLGHNLRETIAHDTPVREAAMFGIYGGPINVTDGRHVYMIAPRNPDTPLYQYTLMPTHMNRMFGVEELQHIEIAAPFAFTKGCPLMKIESQMPLPRADAGAKANWYWPETLQSALYDIETDPEQHHPFVDETVQSEMRDHLARLMRECDAPVEGFERMGLAVSV